MTARTGNAHPQPPTTACERTTTQHPRAQTAEQQPAQTPLRIPFTKMHGLSNDYIFINAIAHPNLTQHLNLQQLAINISNRRTGVGADGLILLEPPPTPQTSPSQHTPTLDADVRMRMFNADGSIGEMCGNGARCLAVLAAQTRKQQHPHTNPTRIRIHAGHLNPRTIDALLLTQPNSPTHPSSTPHTTMVQIDMGAPNIDPSTIRLTSEGHFQRWNEQTQASSNSSTPPPTDPPNQQQTPTGTLQSRFASKPNTIDGENTNKHIGQNQNHLGVPPQRPVAHSTSTNDLARSAHQSTDNAIDNRAEQTQHDRQSHHQEHELFLVSMGNPHAVVFVETQDQAESLVRSLGPIIQNHPYFPGGINLHAAVVLSTDHILMRTWERGSGYTHACGTGACAVLAAALHQSLLSAHDLQESNQHPLGPGARITLPGGTLRIAQNTTTGHIIMTGPATKVCEGFWDVQPSEYTT